MNFSYTLIASTVVEQSFSVSKQQIHANDSDHTVKDIAQYTMSFKQEITREMQHKSLPLPNDREFDTDISYQHTNLLGSKVGRLEFLR